MFLVFAPIFCLIVASPAMAQLGRRAGFGILWIFVSALAGLAPALFLLSAWTEAELPGLRNPAIGMFALIGSPLVLTLQASILAYFPWPRYIKQSAAFKADGRRLIEAMFAESRRKLRYVGYWFR